MGPVLQADRCRNSTASASSCRPGLGRVQLAFGNPSTVRLGRLGRGRHRLRLPSRSPLGGVPLAKETMAVIFPGSGRIHTDCRAYIHRSINVPRPRHRALREAERATPKPTDPAAVQQEPRSVYPRRTATSAVRLQIASRWPSVRRSRSRAEPMARRTSRDPLRRYR